MCIKQELPAEAFNQKLYGKRSFNLLIYIHLRFNRPFAF